LDAHQDILPPKKKSRLRPVRPDATHYRGSVNQDLWLGRAEQLLDITACVRSNSRRRGAKTLRSRFRERLPQVGTQKSPAPGQQNPFFR
jgi:hypothetical protein